MFCQYFPTGTIFNAKSSIKNQKCHIDPTPFTFLWCICKMWLGELCQGLNITKVKSFRANIRNANPQNNNSFVRKKVSIRPLFLQTLLGFWWRANNTEAMTFWLNSYRNVRHFANFSERQHCEKKILQIIYFPWFVFLGVKQLILSLSFWINSISLEYS